jgi:hypothetical protein
MSAGGLTPGFAGFDESSGRKDKSLALTSRRLLSFRPLDSSGSRQSGTSGRRLASSLHGRHAFVVNLPSKTANPA